MLAQVEECDVKTLSPVLTGQSTASLGFPAVAKVCSSWKRKFRFGSGFCSALRARSSELVQFPVLPTMAHIEAFRALRYDPARVALADVVTQPYDKITPEMQERYYQASPYNLVRIILGKHDASDDASRNVYSRAAGCFADWRRQGVLRQDQEPSIFRYTQAFVPPAGGAQQVREGLIALGRVEDYSAGVVFRHEHTLSKPKADRLDLLRATRAHFGQIFMLYSDPECMVSEAIKPGGAPDFEVTDEYGVIHRLWKVADPEVLKTVRELMGDKKLVIADGHHRYETALTYRNERRNVEVPNQTAPHEFVMMTLVNMDAPGLLILPTHRVVHGLSGFSMEKLREGAGEFFSVEEVDAGIDARRATTILKESAHTGTSILAVGEDRVFLLDRPKASPEVFGSLSFRQQNLDVVQLHKCLLERVLGISEEALRTQANVSYVRDASEAMAIVRNGKANVAFLLNAARIQQVRDIALAGEVLPQKSTDFYPKLLSGLTIYAMD
jgi:uncharacterized protein (DUF1015 family)